MLRKETWLTLWITSSRSLKQWELPCEFIPPNNSLSLIHCPHDLLRSLLTAPLSVFYHIWWIDPSCFQKYLNLPPAFLCACTSSWAAQRFATLVTWSPLCASRNETSWWGGHTKITLILREGNLKWTVKTQFPTIKEYVNKLGSADIWEISKKKKWR